MRERKIRILWDVSIQQKLMWIIMSTSTAALLLACAAFTVHELMTFRASMTHELVGMAEIIGLNSTAALEFRDPDAGEETLAGLGTHRGIVAACIYTPQGNVFATYQEENLEESQISAKPREDGVYLDGGHLLIFRPIMLDNERVGTIHMQHDLRELYGRLNRYAIIAAVVLGVSLLVAFLLSSVLQRVISKPIQHLAEMARLVATNKDYSIRAVKQSQDELGFLTEQFNEMLAQIETRDAALQIAHDELEQRVEERTAELAKSNNELEVEITERKHAEEELKKYREHLEEVVEERTKELGAAQDKLIRQEKLAVLGQLAGGVGHELRNPIGAIKNAAYFLNMAIEDPEPEVKETLDILEKEVEASDGIISGLLDYARPKPATRLKVDINDVVQTALSRVPVPENVEVVRQLSETLPPILADPNQLNQVFGNLIWNAIQAMPEGGRLVVKTSASSVEPSEAPSPERVAISFTDTGTGIDEETLAKVFEPLFTTKVKGIGLGLALTKLLIERHGGTVEAQSEVGKGSTFTVKLPVS